MLRKSGEFIKCIEILISSMVKMTSRGPDPLLTSTLVLVTPSDIRWRLENPTLEDEEEEVADLYLEDGPQGHQVEVGEPQP